MRQRSSHEHRAWAAEWDFACCQRQLLAEFIPELVPAYRCRRVLDVVLGRRHRAHLGNDTPPSIGIPPLVFLINDFELGE